MVIEMKSIFVTVGTTQFDDLTDSVFSNEFAKASLDLGYESITIQIGRGKEPIIPENAINFHYDAEKSEWKWILTMNMDETEKKLTYTVYRLKADIADDIKTSSLVISQAGAGSIFEALRAQKTLIIASNPALAGNHQVELLDEMTREHHAIGINQPVSSATVCDALRESAIASLRPFPPLDQSLFVQALSNTMREHQKRE